MFCVYYSLYYTQLAFFLMSKLTSKGDPILAGRTNAPLPPKWKFCSQGMMRSNTEFENWAKDMKQPGPNKWNETVSDNTWSAWENPERELAWLCLALGLNYHPMCPLLSSYYSLLPCIHFCNYGTYFKQFRLLHSVAACLQPWALLWMAPN